MTQYIIFWQRLANSGIIGPVEASSARSAVERFGYPTDHVRHTVVKFTGRPVVIGTANWMVRSGLTNEQRAIADAGHAPEPQ